MGVDNLLLDPAGRLAIGDSARRIVVQAEDAIGFHVYVPDDAGFFCVEPVTHRPNDFNTAGGEGLAPGATGTLAMRLLIS